MTNNVGTEQSNTLSQGGTRLDEQSRGLSDRMQSLIDVLDQDGQALQGNALRAYRQGQAELVTGFQALIDWCNKYGVNLNLGQEKINSADAQSEEDFSKAQSELSYLSRNI
ncbi:MULTISPECIES: hypothetical protein [Nocardiopsis]|uniref:hypothetical protein n=1 Tax=Nocardiopsis TaxID=2013 RepID=UPI000346A2DD|nr:MULTISPECIES: hypothetical protein [Nocardiopsis]PWV47216.1 hypothetical protein BDW27_11214 [Nocardiopsis sp. L17-MgMaSL7]